METNRPVQHSFDWQARTLAIFLLLLSVAPRVIACDQQFPEWKRGPAFSIEVTMDTRPLSNIKVFLQPKGANKRARPIETSTNENGIAYFDQVAPGQYYIEASRLGLQVAPGTVIVSKKASSEQIHIGWPLRTKYVLSMIAGRFERHFFNKQHPVEGYIHRELHPLSGTKLTLIPIDSKRDAISTVTDSGGNFSFPPAAPGYYLLHVEEPPSPEFAYPLNDYLLIDVDPASTRPSLNLQLDWTSCGMESKDILQQTSHR
jgi:hypothetical protein